MNGSNFASGATVLWNGSALSTSFVSANQLTASVPSNLIASPGSASITVQNPGGATTNALTFTVSAPTPSISNLSPSSATAGGPGFTLTVNGSGFLSGSTVQWNGSALSTSYVNSGQLTASVAANLIASAGTATVMVVNPGGGTSNGVTFTVNALTITSLSPNLATAGGGAFTLTVNGSGFVSGSTVRWNGASLPTTFVSGTQLNTTVSAGLIASAGTATITTVNPGGGTSNGVTFTVNALTITSLNPNVATAGGPAFTLTVSGAGYVNGSTVQWNGSALSTTFLSTTQVTATVPANLIASAGTATLTVVNPGGGISNGVTFTVNTLTITSLNPNAATVGGPAFTLTVRGAGYVNGSTVRWNGVSLSTTFVSGTQLNAAVSAGLIASAGTATITVLNPGGGTSNGVSFIVNALTITSVSPNAATTGGSAFTLTVNGAGFVSSSTVQWNGSLLSTTFVSATQLTATVPAGLIASAGTASVTVVNPGGGASNGVVFTVNALTITSLSPNAATTGGSAFTLTINGTGFVSGSTVQWNGSALSTTFVSATQLTATVPPSQIASAGTATVTVVNPGGATSNAAAFTINAPNIFISGLSPNSATAGGSAFTLTVNGSGFVVGLTVQWNGSALYTSYVSGTQLTAMVPASLIASAGTASVTVVNSGGATSPAATFTINAPTPSISRLSPASVTAGGPPYVLTVNGTGFVSGSTVQCNGVALACTFVSATQTTCTIPASLIASAGTVTCTVVNPGGSTSNALSFTIGSTSLTITTPSLPGGTVGTTYSQTLAATGGTSPYSNWVLNSGSLPPGLILDASSGIISGVPSSATGSPFSFTVIVKDATGTVSPPQSLSIAISQPSGLTIITSSPLPAGTVGVPYSQAFAATSGVTPYRSWAITVGSIPPGTSMSTLGGVLAGLLTGTPTAAGTSSFTVQVTDNAGATASKPFSLTINPSGTVTVLPNGITNAASYVGGGVAPGEMVTIFGSGMGPNTLVGLQVDSNGNFAKTLAGVQVLFDNVAAPLVYVQANQVSAVVPYGVSGKTATQVQVVYQGQTSTALTVPVVSAMPGIFTIDYSGKGAGAILNQDGTVNSASNPAATGSYISVYATGEGQTNPPGVDGRLDGSPAPQPVQKVTGTIGGISATVQYAGGSPGLVAGVLQVNLQVPQTLASGNAVPVVLNIGGATSQTGVTIVVNGSGTGNLSVPTLASLSPNTGAAGTTVPVTLTGTNFVAGANVSVSNPGVAVNNVNVVSGTHITATFTIATGATTGSVNVTVTTTGGNSGPVPFTVTALTAGQTLAIKSLSNSSPQPLTPLYINTTGVDPTSQLLVQFSNSLGFSMSEQPIRFATDGTVVAAVPLYVNPSSGDITQGTVSVTLKQGSLSSAPVTLDIQNLPPVSSYGTKLGQISHAFLTYAGMLTGSRINQLQAYQRLPGIKVDTSEAQGRLQGLLNSVIKSRIDVDEVSANDNLVLKGPVMPNGIPLQFDHNALDIMDRTVGVYLTEIAPIISSTVSVTTPSSSMFSVIIPEKCVSTEAAIAGASPEPATVPAGGSKATTSAASGSIEAVLNAISLASNQINLAKAVADYHASDSTSVDKGLAVANGLGSLYGSATVGEEGKAGRAGSYYGAIVAGASLLNNLGLEMGDLLFLIVASGTKVDSSVTTEAWDDLQKNARDARINTVSAELSLAELGEEPVAFGLAVSRSLRSFVASDAGALLIQSGDLVLSTYDCAAVAPGGCYANIANISVQAAANTPTQFSSSTRGFGIIDGAIQLGNTGSPVVVQSELQLSSNNIMFTNAIDDAGNYVLVVPLQVDSFVYNDAQVENVSPITQDTANIIDPRSGLTETSYTVDLSSLTSATPFPVPTLKVFWDCSEALTACANYCLAVSDWVSCLTSCNGGYDSCSSGQTFRTTANQLTSYAKAASCR